MRLRHLRVRNIRSYVAGSVDFADGTTLIAGDVGAGKTSLLYAIEMALFGTSEVDAAYLVRHGSGHAEVRVVFEDDAHRYEIGRKFRRVRRKGRETFEPEAISFSVDGAKTEYSATELRQRVIELLGFADNPNPQAHSDLWRWAVYVPQERMRDILAARPQDRLETVRKALGVEQYRVAAENAQDVAADLRRSSNARRSEAERLRPFDEAFAAWSTEADRQRVERTAVEDAVHRAEEIVSAIRAESVEADAEVRRLESDRRELEGLVREDDADARTEAERAQVAARRTDELARLRAEVAAHEDRGAEAASLRRAVLAVEEEIARLRSRADANLAATRRLAAARAEQAATARALELARDASMRAAAAVAAARATLEELVRAGPAREPPAPTPDSLEAIDGRLARARATERATLAESTRAETARLEFEELIRVGVCPRCGQTVTSREFEAHRSESVAAEERAVAAHVAAEQDRSRIEDERRSRERYERARDRWNEVERERAGAREEVARREADERTASDALASAESRWRDASARVEADAPAEALEGELRLRLATLDADRTALAARLETAATAAERVRLATSAITVLEAEDARARDEGAAWTARREARRARIAELRPSGAAVEIAARRLAESTRRKVEAEHHLEEGRRTLVRVDGRLDEAVRRVAEAERGRADRARLVAEATELDAKAEWISGPFRRAVLTMEQRLLAHAQAVFERNLTRFFATLVDDPSFVARTDVAFTPAVAIDGEWTPAEALSGGERTSLALAFRLALAEVVRTLGHLKLDTILLDEPTDGFSPEQVVRMGELLDALALPQVVLVSHEEALSGIADRVIRVEKSQGRSVVRTPGRPSADEMATEPSEGSGSPGP
jgi:DNA repair protein SbcC/Rad50